MKKNYLYHSTSLKNLDRILKQGLKPSVPKFPKRKLKGVYLSKHPFSWMEYATKGKAGVLLKIDVSGLRVIKDTAKDRISLIGQEICDFICLEPIVPERIKEISTSTERTPNSFIIRKKIPNKNQVGK